VVVDYKNAAPVTNGAYRIVTSGDDNESNNTVTISGAPTWMTINGAKTIVSQTGTGTTQNADFNVTIDTNQTIGDTNTTVTYKVTDEFGKANATDGNVTYFFNALPNASVKTAGKLTHFNGTFPTSIFTADINATDANGTTTTFNVENCMGGCTVTAKDNNGTSITATVIKNIDINATTGKGTFDYFINDLNVTGASDTNITITDSNSTKTVNIDVNNTF